MPYLSIRNGKIQSPKLEYNLVDHCNFSCDECSHLSPYLAPGSQSHDVFVRDLSRLADVYRVDRFRFVGGEPLLNRNALEFVRSVRSSGIARVIEFVSNGALAHKAPDELLRNVDILTVSRYPDIRVTDEKMLALKRRSGDIGFRLRIEKIGKFRRMQTRANDDEHSVAAVYRSCMIAHTWYCQTFYDGYFYLCSRPIYTDAYLRRAGGRDANLRIVDGIGIHEPDLRDRLIAAMNRTNPFESCRHCLGTVGRTQAWRQLSRTQRRHPTKPESAVSGISIERMRSLLAWRRMERAVLAVLPSARIARALSAGLTAIVGD